MQSDTVEQCYITRRFCNLLREKNSDKEKFGGWDYGFSGVGDQINR